MHSAETEARLWLTKRIVRPLCAISPISPEAPLLEGLVADAEHLVDEQDLGLEERRDGECQPHVHAARVPLHRRVDEPLHLGEPDDVVELRADLGPPHAEDRAVQEDVLSAGQLGMKAGSDLEQRADPPVTTARPRSAR